MKTDQSVISARHRASRAIWEKQHMSIQHCSLLLFVTYVFGCETKTDLHHHTEMTLENYDAAASSSNSIRHTGIIIEGHDGTVTSINPEVQVNIIDKLKEEGTKVSIFTHTFNKHQSSSDNVKYFYVDKDKYNKITDSRKFFDCFHGRPHDTHPNINSYIKFLYIRYALFNELNKTGLLLDTIVFVPYDSVSYNGEMFYDLDAIIAGNNYIRKDEYSSSPLSTILHTDWKTAKTISIEFIHLNWYCKNYHWNNIHDTYLRYYNIY